MIDPKKTPNRTTAAIFLGLTVSIVVFDETFEDLVAIIIIVASVTGLAFNWLSRQYSPEEKGWQEERENWEKADRWW
ncbi:MAG: hypothetical protein BRD31_02625 [Bacteroidetes bacterium QH_2_64_26]|nr:MAG: hypothetical protein BRD31_02625 [Bacteroidetes bacterium QH_2_64_26]